MDNHKQFWKEKIKLIPLEIQKQWILEMYPLSELIDFDNEEKLWRWTYLKSHLCRMYLDDPFDWFILKAWKYLENKGE